MQPLVILSVAAPPSIHHSMLHVAAADCITCELFKFWLLSHLNPTKPPLESCMPLPCIAASWLSVSLCNTITITHHLSGKQMMLHVTLSSHIRCRQRLEREANGGYTLGQALRLDSERKPGQQQQHNAECQEQRTADSGHETKTKRRWNFSGHAGRAGLAGQHSTTSTQWWLMNKHGDVLTSGAANFSQAFFIERVFLFYSANCRE